MNDDYSITQALTVPLTSVLLIPQLSNPILTVIDPVSHLNFLYKTKFTEYP